MPWPAVYRPIGEIDRRRINDLYESSSVVVDNIVVFEEESSRGPRVLVALAAGVATPRRVSVGGGYCAAMSAMDFAPS